MEYVIKLICIICWEIGKILEENMDKWLDLHDSHSPVYHFDELEEKSPQENLAARYCDCLVRITTAIDFGSSTIAQIQQALAGLYSQNNPKLQAAAFVCVAQMSEIGKFEKINSFVTFIYSGLNCVNNFVRFYAIYALSVFSETKRPDFQNKYYHEFMPLIVNGIGEGVERVAHQWLVCLSKFI